MVKLSAKIAMALLLIAAIAGAFAGRSHAAVLSNTATHTVGVAKSGAITHSANSLSVGDWCSTHAVEEYYMDRHVPGYVREGFILNPECTHVQLSLVSYWASGPSWPGNLPQQIAHSYTHTYDGSADEVFWTPYIAEPRSGCYGQDDFVYGTPIANLSESNSYSNQGRLIDYRNYGTAKCAFPTPPPARTQCNSLDLATSFSGPGAVDAWNNSQLGVSQCSSTGSVLYITVPATFTATDYKVDTHNAVYLPVDCMWGGTTGSATDPRMLTCRIGEMDPINYPSAEKVTVTILGTGTGQFHSEIQPDVVNGVQQQDYAEASNNSATSS